MPAVQFNNYENLLNSFEHKHNEEMNGKNMCVYLSVIHRPKCSRLFFFGFVRNLLCAFSN